MKLLRCIVCFGEIDIIGNDRSTCKKVKCIKCGFTNDFTPVKEPEVFIVRKRIKE